MKELLVCVLILTVGTGAVMALTPQMEITATEQVIVAPGDTLWSFISSIDGREKYDGQEIVNAIQDMNDMDSVALTPGETITIPKEVK